MSTPNHRPPKPRRIREEMNKDFFSIYETAELLGLHHNTIRRMIKAVNFQHINLEEPGE